MPPNRKVAKAQKQAKKERNQQRNLAKKVRQHAKELTRDYDAAIEEIGNLQLGETYELIFLVNGETIARQQYNRNGRNTRDGNTIFYDWFYENGIIANYYSGDTLNQSLAQFSQDSDARFIIKTSDRVTLSKIKQVYREGETNTCLLDPILEWAMFKQMNADSVGTKKRYGSMIKHVKLFMQKYSDGVPEDAIQEISEKLQINITIQLPFQKKCMSFEPSKKALTTFRFVNTRLNHVDKIVNDGVIEMSSDEIQTMYNDLKSKDEYFHYKKSRGVVTSITTLKGRYMTKKPEFDIMNDFEESTGLKYCTLDEIHDAELSAFVREGTHFNETVDLKDVFNYSHEEGDGLRDDFKHMDCMKQYANAHKCTWFEGYLGKITDYRKCDRIMGLGMYRITNLRIHDARFKQYNQKMKIYCDGRIYPSPELEFLKQYADFDIVEGCYGSVLDFKFSDYPDMMGKFEANKLHKDGEWEYKMIPLYSWYVGKCYMSTRIRSEMINGSEDFLSQIIIGAEYEEDYHSYYYNRYEKELTIKFENEYAPHLSQFSSFITSYSRINVLEQLMTMEYDDVIRVCVDGIYYHGSYDCLNIFRDKPEFMKFNIAGNCYISMVLDKQHSGGSEREHHMKELHLGQGGGGKTHAQLVDKGLQKVCYIAPSWKLARAKREEYGCKSLVWEQFVNDDIGVWKSHYRRFNVLIFDEVSMMTEKKKQLIFNRYPLCKIIFCGDLGYQAPPWDVGETEVSKEGFDYIEQHNVNHRVKDEKLLSFLTEMRKNIDNPTKVTKMLKTIPVEKELSEKYDVRDFILVRTNARIEKYNKIFADKEKYMCKACDREFSNGQIVFEKPPIKHEFRHAFTVHSIQGETAKHMLYIDPRNMDCPRVIYTAVSRAREWNQIRLV